MPHKEKIALFRAAFWKNGNLYGMKRKGIHGIQFRLRLQQVGNNGEKLQRIYISPINFYSPVQMRAADPPGGATQPYLITSGNMLAGDHLDFI